MLMDLKDYAFFIMKMKLSQFIPKYKIETLLLEILKRKHKLEENIHSIEQELLDFKLTKQKLRTKAQF